jgi:uncharacterized damage-inducible protein DinB
MLLPLMRQRIVTALGGTIDVLSAFLGTFSSDDPIWDKRPDPDRFTLREIVAHFADYELIWTERLSRTRDEDTPVLQPRDPGKLAIDNNYAASDPIANLARIRDRRHAIVALLRDLPETSWQRTARWGDSGVLTLEEQAAFIVVHDGYHTSQIAQWLRA